MFKHITNILEFWKVKKILLEVYEEAKIPEKFSQIYNTTFKVDKAGRIYGVIHPKDFGDSMIYSYNTNNMNIDDYMYKCIMDRVIACETVTKDATIFDIMGMEVQIIDRINNIYLLIFKPYNFDEYSESRLFWIKTLLWILGVTTTSGVVYGIVNYFIK